MKSATSLARRIVTRIGLLGALALWDVPGLSAQPSSQAQDAEDAINQLIVRIDTDLEFGAGIIFSIGPDIVHIATANHVVRRGPREAERVELQFRGRPGKPVLAKLLSHRDETLDLAVLSVTGLKNLALDPAALPFDRLGDPQSLSRGDPLFLLGHPNGLPWRVNTVPERFIERREDFLDFESNLIAKGHSGGALLNDDRELIGMLKSDQAPYGEAVTIATIARKLEGWGYSVQLGFPAPRVSSGDQRTCLLLSRGESRCWGHDPRFEYGPPTMNDRRLKSITTGSSHVCGIAAGGAAFCMGSNAAGQLGDGSKTSHYDSPAAVQGGLAFASLSAGFGHTCGIVRSGEAYCWGGGSEGQLGSVFPEGSASPVRVPGNDPYKAVTAGTFYSCGLTTAGEALCWGAVAGNQYMSGSPVSSVPGNLRFSSLAAGYHHVCGLATGGAAFCFGFNDRGQLGIGSVSERFIEDPSPVSGGLRFKSLSAGVSHSCGVTTAGTAYCWGLNKMGQLGNGSKTDSSNPVRVSGALSFTSISAGNLHTCGVTSEEAVYCWGENENGGVGPSGQREHTVPWRVPDADRER
jgi:alpha-tubulin suppressor-like RCC1 family protein